MQEKKIKFNHQETIIKIENNILSEDWHFLDKNKRYVIITDKTVANIYKKLINSIPNGIAILALKPGDNINSLTTYEKIIKNFISLKITKQDIIISFGGESIQKLANLIASTYLNGIELIQIPTTLLSQINSSIIGNSKLFIDNNEICGTNNLPSKIIIDASLINSLPEREILKGITNIIKLGIIKDANLIDDILEKKLFDNPMHISYIIDKCLDVNYSLSTKKEYLNNTENLLNFGNLYFDLINKHTKYKLESYEVTLLSMYFEIKDSLKQKILSAYEVNFDIKRLNSYIEELKNLINKFKTDTKIDIIKIGFSRLKR